MCAPEPSLRWPAGSRRRGLVRPWARFDAPDAGARTERRAEDAEAYRAHDTWRPGSAALLTSVSTNSTREIYRDFRASGLDAFSSSTTSGGDVRFVLHDERA
jgi:hypothetical protein